MITEDVERVSEFYKKMSDYKDSKQQFPNSDNHE